MDSCCGRSAGSSCHSTASSTTTVSITFFKVFEQSKASVRNVLQSQSSRDALSCFIASFFDVLLHESSLSRYYGAVSRTRESVSARVFIGSWIWKRLVRRNLVTLFPEGVTAGSATGHFVGQAENKRTRREKQASGRRVRVSYGPTGGPIRLPRLRGARERSRSPAAQWKRRT